MLNYKISVDYQDYFKICNKITSMDIKVDDDAVIFKTDKPSIEYLNKHNFKFIMMENIKEKVHKKIIGRKGIIIGLILIIFVIYINTYRVDRIVFNGNYPINDEIEVELSTRQKDLLFWSFSSKNYSDVGRQLRAKYYQYEWISVSKVGTSIKVDVYPTTTKTMTETKAINGDIVAKKSGIVKEFRAFNGKPIVVENQYITKDQVLISGNMLANTDQTLENWTNAKGYILAMTYEEVTVNVLKVQREVSRTGRQGSSYGLSFFNNDWKFSSASYNTYDQKVDNIFLIPYVFGVKKFYEYEKSDIIYTHTEKTACEYAQSYIEALFAKDKVIADERIEKLERLLVEESADEYKITYLVKKLESVGTFKEHLNEVKHQNK